MVGVEEMITDSQSWTNVKQHVVSKITVVIIISFGTILINSGIDVCTLQPDPGNCRGSFPRYFYNKLTRKCERFIYGGCGGNGNRFNDVSSCEDTCISSG